jgi:hypothetical protein
MYCLRPRSLFPAACRVSRSLHYRSSVSRQFGRFDKVKSAHEGETGEFLSDGQVITAVELKKRLRIKLPIMTTDIDDLTHL